MKRWIALGVCALLLLSSGLLFIKQEVTVGKGRGTGEKIETIEEFFDLADSASSYEFKNKDSANSAKGTLLAAAEHDPGDGDAKDRKYTNLTFNEVSSIMVDQKIETFSAHITLQRELTGYMTEDAVYYHSEGAMTLSVSSSSGRDEDGSMSFLFDMDIYYSGEDCYIRFHEFRMVAEAKNINVPDEWRDVWISLGGEEGESVRSAVGMVNSYNFSVLNYIGDLFDEYSDGKLKKDRKRYLLEGRDFNVEKGSLEINLENENSPRLSLLAPYVSDMIEFSNIGNTVVKLPQNFSAYDITDLEEYFEEHFNEEDFL